MPVLKADYMSSEESKNMMSNLKSKRKADRAHTILEKC